ncbi:MAG TPA: urease accessory protein UreE [Arsenicitalea sp.]|jgi:urease accessory protein|nr:urease accessory protein UreE [Arsenicitalea sp.]
MIRVTAYLPAGTAKGAPADTLTLAHDERRLRRKLLTLPKGDEIFLDFPQALSLENGDRLQLEDGRTVEIRAADEAVFEIRGRDAAHLSKLAWHIGNRHLPAQIEKSRILIKRDHVIRDMLVGLGATVTDTTDHFSPEHGAYHSHSDAGHALLNR